MIRWYLIIGRHWQENAMYFTSIFPSKCLRTLEEIYQTTNVKVGFGKVPIREIWMRWSKTDPKLVKLKTKLGAEDDLGGFDPLFKYVIVILAQVLSAIVFKFFSIGFWNLFVLFVFILGKKFYLCLTLCKTSTSAQCASPQYCRWDKREI